MPETCKKTIDSPKILHDVISVLAVEEPPVKVAEAILYLLRDPPGISGAELLLYHQEMNLLYPHRAEQECQAWGGLQDPKKGFGSRALRELKTIYLPDVSESGINSPFPGAQSLLSLPLITSGRIHGVLNIGTTEKEGFDSDEILCLEIIGTFVAQLLEKVNLREAIFDLQRRLIESISAEIDDVDPTYSGHAERVSSYAVAIGAELGLTEAVLKDIERSGYLHDIGKAGVSPVILTKPGELTEEEFNEVKMHTIHSRFLLTPLGFMPRVLEGIATHHERWDGDGYPKGLKGDEIPIEGRILAVAETLDVLTSDQHYRKKLTPRQALQEIKINSGGQFDPEVVDALCKAVDGFRPESTESETIRHKT